MRELVGLGPCEAAPDPPSRTRIRRRLGEEVFSLVLRALRERGLLRRKMLVVDCTMVEAHASMGSLRRKRNDKAFD